MNLPKSMPPNLRFSLMAFVAGVMTAVSIIGLTLFGLSLVGQLFWGQTLSKFMQLVLTGTVTYWFTINLLKWWSRAKSSYMMWDIARMIPDWSGDIEDFGDKELVKKLLDGILPEENIGEPVGDTDSKS